MNVLFWVVGVAGAVYLNRKLKLKYFHFEDRPTGYKIGGHDVTESVGYRGLGCFGLPVFAAGIHWLLTAIFTS